MHTVGSVKEVLDQAYPPHLAEDWDAVGLICGDPEDDVNKVAFALDCTLEVAQAAVDMGADMLVVHHPLLMRGVTTVAADTPKGKIIHLLIKNGVALMAAHTNADKARPGVNDKLAQLVGIEPGAPLQPHEPGSDLGLGRIGRLPQPMRLADFAQQVANALPATEWGIRVAGDPERMVHNIVVSSGSGDSFLDKAAQAGADVYVTSDLRHHPVDETLRAHDMAVIDTAHWASEFPWTAQARDIVVEHTGLEAEIIDLRTDPWTLSAHKEN